MSGILTVSSLSGVLLKDVWLSSMVCPNIPSIYTETEFRFNHRRDNLYYQILKLLRLNPI